MLISYISCLAIKIPEKKFSSETLAAIYVGKVMTMVMTMTMTKLCKYWLTKTFFLLIVFLICFFYIVGAYYYMLSPLISK